MKSLKEMKIVMPNLIEAGIGRATLQYDSWALLCEKVREVNALLDSATPIDVTVGKGFLIPWEEPDSAEKLIEDLSKLDKDSRVFELAERARALMAKGEK